MANFDYGTLHTVVASLLAGSKTEAELRSAANRAYYSAYGCLRKRLVTEAPPDRFGTAGKHASLVAACAAHRDTNISSLGKILESLKLLRNTADYHWLDDVNEPDVQKAKAKAAIAVQKIRMIGKRELGEIHASL